MESPFPGMDPYLEAPSLWPDVHHRLISTMAEQLQPLLSSRYTANIVPHVTLETLDITIPRLMVPDVGIVEREDSGGGARPRSRRLRHRHWWGRWLWRFRRAIAGSRFARSRVRRW